MTKAVLLRVGIDSGCGGIQGPLFADGSFEFICIPDNKKVSKHQYGNCIGKNGLPYSEYFSKPKRDKMSQKHIHLDPEFSTFTYGDPTSPKRSLRNLQKGDLLIFYCGLQEWDRNTGWQKKEAPALYIVGFFVVELAGMANDFSKSQLKSKFGQNFHVHYPSVFEVQREDLVLVKGGEGSRLLSKACKISSVGKDRQGKPLKILSLKMQEIFGDFDGKVSIQRSPPRWIESSFVDKAISFVSKLK